MNSISLPVSPLQESKGHITRPIRKISIVMIGAYSLLAQVILFRTLYSIFSGTEFLLGILLSSWMLWVSLGSGVLWSLLQKKESSSLEAFLLFSAVLLLLSESALRIVAPTIVKVPGELVAYSRMALTTVVSVGPCAILSGYLFALAASKMRISHKSSFISGGVVYAWEALGSGAAGMALGLVLLNHIGNLGAIWLLVAVSLSLFFWAKVAGNDHYLLKLFVLIAPLIILVLCISPISSLDAGLDARRFRGFRLLNVYESPYGRIDVVEREGQRSLYVNSVAEATAPNIAEAEEKVHFPLLLHGSASSVLYLGGAYGNITTELAKHNLKKVTVVELDEQVMRAASSAGLFHKLPEVEVFIGDSRNFLLRDQSKYDAIILGVGEPVSLKLNRYYSREFFEMARARLSENGIIALSLPGGENFLTESQERFFSCIYRTMIQVLPSVEYLPGEISHFVGFNDSTMRVGPEAIATRLSEKAINVKYISPSTLAFRFSDLRMKSAAGILKWSKSAEVNRDFTFSGYILDALMWNQKLGFKVPRWMESIMKERTLVFWIALLVFCLGYFLLFALAGKRRRQSIALSSILLIGTSGMGGSIVILVIFQVLFGSLYQWVAILSGIFMVGTGLSTLLLITIPKKTISLEDTGNDKHGNTPGNLTQPSSWLYYEHLISAFVFLLLVVLIILSSKIPALGTQTKIFLCSMDFLLGAVLGAAYVSSCSMLGKGKRVPSLVYAFDILGGFLGAGFFASFILPVAGALLGTCFLLLINAAGAVVVKISRAH